MWYNHHMNLEKLKKRYESEGFLIVGIFGSVARGEEDPFSDIDIAYKIDHSRFFPDNAFKKLIRIEEIKKELESIFGKRVDLVPYKESFGIAKI